MVPIHQAATQVDAKAKAAHLGGAVPSGWAVYDGVTKRF